MSVISIVKQLNEKIPYEFKKPFSGLIRRQLINHPVFIETLKTLEKADSMTAEEIETLQLKRLKSVLIRAATHSPYYHDLFRRIRFEPEFFKTFSDLELIPVLTKTELKKHYNEILTDDIHDSYEVSTGGSTGVPLTIQMEKDAIYREWAFIYHYWANYGYDYHTSKLATLRGVDIGNQKYVINPLYNEIRLNIFMLNEISFMNYIKAIDEFEADFLYGYPSAVFTFCRLANSLNVNIKGRFKGIFLISENLYSFQEKLIEDTTNSPIAIFYGHTERCVFAERYNGVYRFNPLYGVIEFSDEGFPIVTGFINRKTLLIRYVLDDLVEPAGDGVYRITGHRESDIIYGKNGEEFRASLLDFHGVLSKNLSDFQIMQQEPGKITILYTDDISDDFKNMFVDNSKRKFGESIDISFNLVENIQKTKRGKYKILIQKYNMKIES